MTAAGVIEHRPLLFAIAYRLLGSASEAEDIVQEAYLRTRTADEAAVRDPKAYLSTIVTRLCLDQLKSARARREQYVGPWLPEPVLTPDTALGPLETVEQRESISLAFLVMLETLTPAERAVLVLREVFDYSYEEIGAIIEASPAACRQMLHRARERVAARRPRFQPAPEQQRALVERFLAAAAEGDLAALETMLADDATVWSDGGGKVVAAQRPVIGRERVSRFVLGLARRYTAEMSIKLAEINGSLAFVIWDGGELYVVWTPEFDGARLVGLRATLNPEKLAFLERQLAARGIGPPA
jgi:RNA polymerase sigma-70 factor (ECF subfamily)